MTEMNIPARREVPASWVNILKDHLLGEVVQERARLRRRRYLVLAPESPPRRTRRRRTGRGRVRLFALAAAVAVAAVLSIPAFGVGPKIVSLFAGMRDPDAAVPTGSDVLIASGEAGVAWKLLATRSDQGLCLDLFHRMGNDRFGGAGCGYIDIRGDLPPDIRGDPASKCIPARPTTRGLVPCGSLPQHWIGPLAGGGSTVGLDHTFAFGPLAEDVASVELILTDGQTVRAHVVEQPEGLPLNFYWAAWPCPLQPVLDYPPYAGEALCAEDGAEVEMAIARDAAGRVLERRVPAWNGNPTGDPDGPPPPTTQGS
jgi:hypothetical protein